jgi:hypothetical protein
MLTERETDLIQLDVDGRLAVADRAELSRLLLGSPDARQLHGQLGQLAQALASMPVAEPPAGLHDDILTAVHWRGRRAVSGWHSPWRIAAGFAVAALLAGIVQQLARPPGEGIDRAELSGTMARPRAGTELGSTRIELDGVRGSVSVRGPVESRQIDFEVITDRPVDVLVTVGARENRYRLDATGTLLRRSFALDGPETARVDLQFFADGSLVGSARIVRSQ